MNFDEDEMIMSCGHKGSNWSSVWKCCIRCNQDKEMKRRGDYVSDDEVGRT